VARSLLAAGAALIAAVVVTNGQQPPPGRPSPAPRFEDATQKSGLSTFKLTSGSPAKNYIVETMSGGVALIDFDRDGWQDVFFVNGSTIDAELAGNNAVSDRLYRNNHDGTFTDVTRESGLTENKWGMGVAVADVDNDGNDDLFVTNFGRNALYLNTGKGTFRDATAQSGLATESMWSTGAAFGDYDGDGDVDLYVSTYIDLDLKHLPTYDSMPGAAKQNCLYRNLRVFCGPLGLRPADDRLYENKGGGRFVDVSRTSGIANVPPGYGMGVLWLDVNEDDKPDLYVANDRNPNYLFTNNGDGTFTETGMLSGAAVSAAGKAQAGMGVDAGDYDNDGHLDLVVTNFSDDYNTLYRGEGSTRFGDVTVRSGTASVGYPYVGWGTKLADMNNDGRVDWVVANGHVFPRIDGEQTIFGAYAYREPTLLFLNRGGGIFEDASKTSGINDAPLRSNRGLATGDIDNDGRLDVVMSAIDDGPTLLHNVTEMGHWLLLDLKGTVSNRGAIGARITARTGGLVQTRLVVSGDSYLSQSDRRVHLGLGAAASAEEITIRWPSGQRQTLRDVAGNRVLVVTEPASSSPRPKRRDRF